MPGLKITPPSGGLNPSAAIAASSAVATHAAAADPHTAYQLRSEKGAANGYAELGATGLVPMDQLATGTPDGTQFVRDDGTLAVPGGGAAAYEDLTDVDMTGIVDGDVPRWDDASSTWLPAAGTDPTTTAGDMIYRPAYGSYTNEATVAAGASASAQDSYGGWPPSNMIDLNDATAWASNDGAVPKWVKIDLGSSKTIVAVRMLESDGYKATAYDIAYSADDLSYTALESHTVGGVADDTYLLSAATAARYWKFTATGEASSGWHIFALELRSASLPAADRLPIGDDGQNLAVVSGLPAWQHPRIPTKAGVPTDSDTLGIAADGMMILDTTNHRLYIRDGGSWKYAALT